MCFHFKPTWQTKSDRFVPLFSLLLLLSLSNYGKTHCTNILVLLVGLYVQLQHLHMLVHTHTHTHIQTNLRKMMLTVDSCNSDRIRDIVPSQFTDTTNGFLAAP